MPVPEVFDSKFRVATDREIRTWSFGQVTKTRVPNSAPLDDHVGMLGNERIFGPSIEYRCTCGKYDGQKYDGMICDHCGVKITTTDARRTRFGHIDFLSGPVQHPFFASAKMNCFPVIPAVYIESQSGVELCQLYEHLLADPAAIVQLIEYLTPMAETSIRWHTIDSEIFTRGMGLTRLRE